MADKTPVRNTDRSSPKVTINNIWKVLQIDRWLALLDLALLASAIFLIFTDGTIFFFHLIFLLLTAGAFFWRFRAFTIRAGIWVTVVVAILLFKVLAGAVPAAELVEIPLLIIILFLIFAVARQRGRAKEALRSERDTLNTIMENTRAHLAYLDPEFNFVRVNSAYVKGCGHSREELLGHNHFELFPSAENQAIFEHVRDTGQLVEFHAKPFEFPDQPERGITYWDWTLAPVTNEDGQVAGLVLSLLDVTERERADNALRKTLEESRQRQAEVSALLEGSRAVLAYREFEGAARVIFDSCKRLIGATAGYVALLTEDGTENEVLFLDSGGAVCTVDPALPMPIRGLREEAYRAAKTVCENDFPSSEWTRLLPAGHAGLDNVLFAPLVVKGIAVGLLGLANKPGGFNENDARLASAFGELAAIALFNSRTMESLQNSEERFRSVAQTASEAIITIDGRGNVVFWNRAATTIFGYTPDEAVGKPLALIMPERFHPAHQNGIERLVSNGESRILGKTVEMVGLRQDGSEFPVELSLSTWKINDEVFFTGLIKDITERKQAEEEIQSLARFPSENRNPVLRVSQDGTILYANQASDPLLALWASQVGQKLPDTWRQLAADVISTGAGRSVEVASGERIFSVDFAPVEEVGYVNLYGRDITEQVQAEALLRGQNQFITTVFESLRHPFYVIDADDYTIKMANSAALAGELPESITCYALTHKWTAPCGDAENVCPIDETKETGKPVVVEHLHYDQAGDRRYFEVHAHPIFDPEGEVTQIIEYTLDVTERKQMEEALRTARDELELRVQERTAALATTNQALRTEIAEREQAEETLRESEERYRRLVELAFEAIVIHSQGTLVYVNPQAVKLLGGTGAEEFIGKPIRDFVHPDYWDMVQGRVQQVGEEGKGMPLVEEKLVRLDGTSVDVEIASVPIIYQGQPAVQSVIHDISPRRRAETERERERARIARNLHDSLGHSLGYLHLKLDELAGARALSENLEIRRELAQMRDVTNEAYEVVRGMLAASLPHTSTDLATALLVQARSIGQRGGFNVQLASGGQPRTLSPIVQQQLLYLFQEALVNVEKHADARQVGINLEWGEDTLTVSFSDDGKGFDPDNIRADGHFGLAIMQERAREINGQLTLSSCPNTGTLLVLRLLLDTVSQSPRPA